MKTYAKLEDGALRVMGRVPNIVNPTEVQRAEYAAAHGFKELVEMPAPGLYYYRDYVDAGDTITAVWQPIELAEAKRQALDTIQTRRDAAMFGEPGSKGVVIECSALPNGVLFNAEAHNMVNSLMLLDAKGAVPASAKWTDAADMAHPVTSGLIDALVAAMMGHVQGVQDKYESPRAAVNAAEDVDAVEAALRLAEPLTVD